ncbi:MAG: N-acetylmuramoyl-L-alanine amidase [Rhodospirillaceae bacterium]|nr:N-acetylmuramoyl-L-alanine amidase [Rhodospirillaceae bacterium]MBT5373232.1 N-acetylmuramoyl-L-alanine amidase [Rhodospirillaceae bacterium]MBT5658970.1 N-acetylmuramoyl-L-alanine amidase [Rhodospirillaceae bacterium]
MLCAKRNKENKGRSGLAHRSARRSVLWLIGLIFPLFFTISAFAQPSVEKIRFGDYGSRTRVVLDLTGSVEFSYFILGDPYRVVVDLPEISWEIPGISGVGGVVGQYRYGLFKPGTTRLVLDVKTPVRVKRAFILDPEANAGHRLVLDLETISRAEFDKDLRAARIEGPKALSSSKKPDQMAALPIVPLPKPVPKKTKTAAKKIIVLDPGHGGVDPGATGKSGRFEKYITLSMARVLKKKLEKTGRYKVILTREKDIFLRLRDRLKIARQADADLFISLHADSNKNRKIRGLSVYTLSERASDKEAASLATSENKSDVIAGIDLSHETPEVTDILIDLAQRETMNLSSHFANTLIQELRREVKLLRKTHRFAGFAVLKAPDVPSVLVELGYLSNSGEEKKLRDPKYLARLSTALVLGIDKYFKWKDNLSGS